MYIESVQLQNFRNYRELQLDFDKGTNIFYGDNAQGKTNILESVYICGTTKSHKGSKDRDMITFTEEESHIRMLVQKKNLTRRIDMYLKKKKTDFPTRSTCIFAKTRQRELQLTVFR